MMGVEGVHIVETRMFCTVCLKSSCLLICVHSWSLDLSQTLIITNDPNSERGKNWSKTMGKKSPHVTCPASPQTLRPSPRVETCCFVCFFLVCSMFLPPWPKNASKPMEKHKKQKVSPHVTRPLSPQTFSMGRNFMFFYGIRPNKNGT